MDHSDSGFFLPLKGHEISSRLEAKFEHYFDSDEDDNQPIVVKESIGKVSQWKPSPQGQWLKSPSKSKRKGMVASGGSAKYVSPVNKKRVRRNLVNIDSGKTDKTVVRTRESSRDCSAAPSRKKRPEQDIHEYSSEEEAEKNQDFVRDDYKNWTGAKIKQSPKTLKSCESTSPAQVGEKIINVWNVFSDVDAERPKLPVEPVSAKVDFLLSEDDEHPRVAVPATINQYLRDYQREGIQFLFQHFIEGTGAILGDDMGLGKTVQVIGFLAALLGKTGNHTDSLHAVPKFIKQLSNDFPDTPPRKASRPFLIIGPTAVLYNWLDELNTWGYFTVGKFHGSDKDSCFADLKKGKLEIVVTTFETYRDKVEQLNQIEWEAVIVDEAHKIKGLRAQVTQALRIIKTPCRYGLTGTALQNNMTELWSLLDWAQPKILGTLEQFETGFVRAIEIGQKHDATKRELAHARKQRDKFASIRKKMLLRRTKKLIADQLPNKEELVVMCRLTDLQVSVYKAILEHPDMQLVLQAEDPCDCASGKQRASCCYKRRPDGTKVWGLVFSFMHLMLKAANHVGLLIPDGDSTRRDPACLCDSDDGEDLTVKEKPGAALARSVFLTAFKDQPQFVELTRSAAFRTLSDPRYCGKMKILQGLLGVFEKNHDKVLIFSYSTKLLDIIELYIISQGHEYSRIDGKASGQKRRDIVLKFNTDPSLFICLISTKAGGLGLNLTGANKVVIFDPNWNPSHDLQAQDRAYRIGQTRHVKVFRLVSAGTIEENIYLRQIYKQQLDEVAIGNINAKRYFRGVQGDKSNQGELFGVKNMFALRTGNVCLTMDILKRNERLEQGLGGYDITKYVPPKVEAKTSNDIFSDDEEDSTVESYSDDDKAENEDKEGDENFLRDLFGLDHIELKPSSSVGKKSRIINQQGQIMEKTNESSDSDSDELSLVPVRSTRKQKEQSRWMKDYTKANCSFSVESSTAANSSHFLSTVASPGKGVGSKSAKNISTSNAFDELFDMSDITFSTTRASINYASHTHTDTDKISKPVSHAESPDIRDKELSTSPKRSGLSWLFPTDSEHESGDDSCLEEESDKVASHAKKMKSKKRSVSPRPGKQSATSAPSGSKKRVQLLDPHNNPRQEDKPGTSKSTQMKRMYSSEQSLLAGSDILHTHTNMGVLGTSRAEDHMTRCAIKDVFELNTNTQAPALVCDPLSQSDGEEDNREQRGGKRKKNPSSQDGIEEKYDKRQSIKAGPYKLLIGQTPPAIARKQFSELARSKGMSVQDFARHVLETSVGCRLEMLKEFYTHKHSHDAVVDVVSNLYSQAPNAGRKASKTEKDNITPGQSKIQEKTSEKLSKSVQQSSHRSAAHGISAPSTHERQRKRGSKESPVRVRKSKPCSSRAPTPFFLEASTLASDSQESITARSPLHCEADGDDNDDSSSFSQPYQPVSPPPKRRLSPHGNKISPMKSQHRTRLRNKADIKRKQMCTTQREYQEIDTQFGSYLPQETFSDQPESSMLRQKAQPREDIPSLLYQMGQPSHDNDDGDFTDQNKLSEPSKRYKNNEDQSKSSKLHDAEASKSTKALSEGLSKDKGMITTISPVKAKVAFAERRKPVSILDDIFGDSSSLSFKEDQAIGNDNTKHESILTAVNTRTIERRKEEGMRYDATSKVDRKLSGSSSRSETKSNKTKGDINENIVNVVKQKHSSKSSQKNAEQSSSKLSNNKSQDLQIGEVPSAASTKYAPSTSAAAAAAYNKDEDSDSEMFGVHMISSTFREGAGPSHIDRSTRNRDKRKKSEKAGVKGSRNKRVFDEGKNDGVDFDDLENWGNFTHKQSVPVESESLFS